ncbi:MAG: hypothetical protein FWC91_03205 [Defluviitaleaceae bacterium]|nr:hypothetical protein [Defluviitaleaceae bacterium]
MKVIKVPKYNNFDEFFYWMLPMGEFWQFWQNDMPLFVTMLYRGFSCIKNVPLDNNPKELNIRIQSRCSKIVKRNRSTNN